MNILNTQCISKACKVMNFIPTIQMLTLSDNPARGTTITCDICVDICEISHIVYTCDKYTCNMYLKTIYEK